MRFLGTIVLLTLVCFVNGQKSFDHFQIQKSKSQRLINGEAWDIIGRTEHGIYIVRRKGSRIILERLNDKLERLNLKEIPLKSQEDNQRLRALVLLDGELTIFTVGQNEARSKRVLSRAGIDPINLLVDKKRKQVASYDLPTGLGVSAGRFNLLFDQGNSVFAVISDYPFHRKDSDSYGIQVMKNNGKKLWEREIKLPYKQQLSEEVESKIDAQGNYYVLAKVYGDGQKGKMRDLIKQKVNFKYVLVAFTNEGKDMKMYTLPVDDEIPTEASMAVNSNGEIIIAGYYSETNLISVKGCFYMRLDPISKKVRASSKKDFGLDFITLNQTMKEKKKAVKKSKKGKSVELHRFQLNKVLADDKGGAVVIGEQYFEESITYATVIHGVQNTTTTEVFHYNDIIVSSIDSEGQFQWIDKIPKRQITTDDDGKYSSYAFNSTDDHLYFIFNDHPRNLKLPDPNFAGKYGVFRKPKESVITMVALDYEGRIERMPLGLDHESGMVIRPGVMRTLDNGRIMLYGLKKRREKFFMLNPVWDQLRQ